MRHISVLTNEVIESLNLKPGVKVVDCTLGDAGHSEKILEKIGADGKLIGIDLDPEAIMRAKQYLYNYEKQVVYERGSFTELGKILQTNGWENCDAILMDLGWSTPQFSERGRGFSFEKSEPLDMRYGGMLENVKTATEILNEKNEDELEKIFKDYGEEKWAHEIARKIVEARKVSPIDTTDKLTELVLQVYREKLGSVKEIPWIGGIHPATQVYQSLRIAVNSELEALKQALPQAINALSRGGRLAIITFHSLEDRLVKHYFQSIVNKTVKIINKKPIIALESELAINPRARSAKLRVVEKL